jgi:hypothetical protein
MSHFHVKSFIVGVVIALGAAVFFAATQLGHRPPAPFNHYTGMEGEWYNMNDKPVYIIVKGNNDVILKDGDGKKFNAEFQGPWMIKVKGQKRTGTIQDGGRRLKWSDGGMWTRYPGGKTHISGTWYNGKQPIEVKVYDNGYHFMVTLKNGNTIKGHAGGAHSLVIPSKNITGHINNAANTVFWSDGKIWTRSPGGSGSGPLRSPAPGGGK